MDCYEDKECIKMELINLIKPKDVIAIIILTMLFILLLKGFNGWVQGSMSFILAYYFIKRMEGKDNGN